MSARTKYGGCNRGWTNSAPIKISRRFCQIPEFAGNSAILSLNENYETEGVRLSPEVPPAAVERVIRSETIAARRNGRTIKLELREVQVRHPGFCSAATVSRAVMIFDPSSHLSWWTQLSFR